MLDYSPYFSRPLVDRKDWKRESMELRGLEVGKYYWRVAAVDKDGVEGSFSDFARFTVTSPPRRRRGAAAPLEVEPLEARGNILQVKGSTEPGASSPSTGSASTWPRTGPSTSSSPRAGGHGRWW